MTKRLIITINIILSTHRHSFLLAKQCIRISLLLMRLAMDDDNDGGGGADESSPSSNSQIRLVEQLKWKLMFIQRRNCQRHCQQQGYFLVCAQYK